MLSKDFLDMLDLFSCAARGEIPERRAINVESVYQSALSHGVSELVFLSLDSLYKSNSITIDSALYKMMKMQTLYSISFDNRSKAVLQAVLQSLHTNGIECYVLKGYAAAANYENPDYRISNDIDLYAGNQDFDTILSVMAQMGFETQDLRGESHHSIFTRQDVKTIEIHQQLYNILPSREYFKNITLSEEFMRIKYSDSFSMNTLGVNDGLLFYTYHLMKHFIDCGVGVRQLMDLLLYVKKYTDSNDWKRYFDKLSDVKFDYFIKTCFRIGIQYLGFTEDIFNQVDGLYDISDSLAERLLEDFQDSGIYGKGNPHLTNFNRYYLKYRSSKNTNRETGCMQTKKQLFFPPKELLNKRYSYTVEHPYLLPVAWLHRIFDFTIALIHKERNINNYLKKPSARTANISVKKRLQLLEEMKMI